MQDEGMRVALDEMHAKELLSDSDGALLVNLEVYRERGRRGKARGSRGEESREDAFLFFSKNYNSNMGLRRRWCRSATGPLSTLQGTLLLQPPASQNITL